MLHNHPLNAQRIAAGLAPVNSLWFWGAGALPDHVRTRFAGVRSDDERLQALARWPARVAAPLPPRWPRRGRADALFDLRHARDLAALRARLVRTGIAAALCARRRG